MEKEALLRAILKAQHDFDQKIAELDGRIAPLLKRSERKIKDLKVRYNTKRERVYSKKKDLAERYRSRSRIHMTLMVMIGTSQVKTDWNEVMTPMFRPDGEITENSFDLKSFIVKMRSYLEYVIGSDKATLDLMSALQPMLEGDKEMYATLKEECDNPTLEELEQESTKAKQDIEEEETEKIRIIKKMQERMDYKNKKMELDRLIASYEYRGFGEKCPDCGLGEKYKHRNRKHAKCKSTHI
jgi:hypothetical protein